MKIIRAFSIDSDGSWTWVVQREDGKYAIAADSDVSVGADAIDAVVEGTEWHDTIQSLRAELAA